LDPDEDSVCAHYDVCSEEQSVAVVLPIIIMGIAAFCLPRPKIKNSDGHWAERARSLFPFKALRIYSLSFLPVIYAVGGNFYPDSIL
jgi:hypothetical protein